MSSKNQGINIKRTIECGQLFRYEQIGQSTYIVRSMNDSCVISQDSFGGIKITDSTTDRDFWIGYLDISNCAMYDKVNELCINSGNEVLKAAAEKYHGTYILKQNPWEVLVSFIISQNNNIPKIRSTINKLCEACCGSIDRFPTTNDILNAYKQDKLSNIGLGYRLDYLVDLCNITLDDCSFDIYRLAESNDYEYHMNTLLKLHGVGPKVANCVCLYGLRDFNAVPEDIWIHRVYEKYPDIDLKKFGDCAGIVQQYLFQYIRDTDKEGDVQSYADDSE